MRNLLMIFSVLLVLTACANDTVDNDTSNAVESDTDTNSTVKYETIELDQIESYIEDGYIVADVREIDEYNSGHIPGSIHVPLSALENGDFTSLEKDKKHVIICRSGNRSVLASNILSDTGFDVVNVREGMSMWAGKVEN